MNILDFFNYINSLGFIQSYHFKIIKKHIVYIIPTYTNNKNNNKK